MAEQPNLSTPSPQYAPPITTSSTTSAQTVVTPVTTNTIIIRDDNCEVPQNDPKAVPGLTFDPYGAPCQKTFYRPWHIAANAWGLGIWAPTLADIPTPESRPKWSDYTKLFRVMSILGYAYSLIAVWDASVDVVATASQTIDPNIGYTVDPWNAPSYLEDMSLAKVFQEKTGIQMVCHTGRQYEVVKLAMAYGVRAKSIKDIPLCPPLLSDVTHYWVGASEIAWEGTHSNFLKNVLKTAKSKILYLFVGSDGRLDLKNITWMITLVLGTAQATDGSVTNLLQLVGINV